MSTFKEQYSEQKRKEVAQRILQRYPDRLPVIVEKAPKSSAPPIDKKKFLVPSDITVGKFLYEIRKHMRLDSEQAIFLFVNDTLPPSASLMLEVYRQHKDPGDSFLYCTYASESTFG